MIGRRRYSSLFCLAALGISILTGCKDEKPHISSMPHAAPGRITLVAGTGFTGLDEHAELPNAQVPVPTGIAAYRDGSLLALVNGDGGTLTLLTSSGQAEPFEYYRTHRKSGSKDIAFDASRSPQKGWLRQQNSSSLIRTANGDLWIYANRWIAAISPENRAFVVGQVKLPEYKDFDYKTRIFNGIGADILLAREGRLYKIEKNLELERLTPPKLVGDITAAIGDGDHLLVGSKNVVYRIDGSRILDKTRLKSGDNQPVGKVVGLTVDGHGGYFAATSAGLIFHVAARKDPVHIAGIGHEPEDSFGGVFNCPPVNAQRLTSNPLTAELGNPESMLLQGDQLYIADAGCSRIYGLGVSR